MKAPLIYSDREFISPWEKFFLVFIVFESDPLFELFNFDAVGFSKLLFLILLSEKFKDNIEGEPKLEDLLFGSSLHGRKITLALMMMHLS